MSIDPSPSPKSSSWLGLEDLSSFDSSPQLMAAVKRKAPAQVRNEHDLAPSNKRAAMVQLRAEPSKELKARDIEIATSRPSTTATMNQLSLAGDDDDDEMLLEPAVDDPALRSLPSTPVSSPQNEGQPPAANLAPSFSVCTICQYSFSDMPGSTPVMRLLRCGHCFCKMHIQSWFETGRNKCPNCQCTYPSLRGRTQELSAEGLVHEEDAARRKAKFTAGADVRAVWDVDGKKYPATVVSVGIESVEIRWKENGDHQNVRFDQVTIDSPSSASAEEQDEETEITIKDKQSGDMHLATVRKMSNGLFSVCYTGTDQAQCKEKLTNTQLARRSKDWSVCTVCGGCHSLTHTVLCDGCNSMCHLQCADPPLRFVPAGNWFCNRALCRRKKDGFVRRGESTDAQPVSIPNTPATTSAGPTGEQNHYIITNPKNQRRVKSKRASFQVIDSTDRAYVMHTGAGDLYHIHFLGWNSRYDEAWTKAMCRERLKDWIDDAPETCSVCGQTGCLLVCDCCDAPFHLACESPELKHLPNGQWFCSSSTCQLRAAVEKYRTEFETLVRLRAEADRRLIFAGGDFAELSERLARDDLKLEPSSPLEAAHAAYPVKARVEVKFRDGWYVGWVERHTDKNVGVRFDEDDSYYTVPLLGRPEKKGENSARRCDSGLLRSVEGDAARVVEDTLLLVVDDVEQAMRAQPMTEILTDILGLLMSHGKALELNTLTSSRQDEAAHNASAVLESADLRTIKRNFDCGQYTTPDEIACDILRFFAGYQTQYLAHTPIAKCAKALGRCFQKLMCSFALETVYYEAERKIAGAFKQRTQKPPKRKLGRQLVNDQQAKDNTSDAGTGQMVKDQNAFLKKVKSLGKHVYDQVQSCLDESAFAVNDDSDRVALGAKLLKGNGELIEEFTEIVLRGKQRRSSIGSPGQSKTRKKLTTFCPEADRYIEYSDSDSHRSPEQVPPRDDGLDGGFDAQGSGLLESAPIAGTASSVDAVPEPNGRPTSTSISFRPSQVAGHNSCWWSPQPSPTHSSPRSITGPKLPERYKVVTILETKAQVPSMGMGLSQQYNSQRAVGPIVVSQCSHGTVAFSAGVREGWELLRFESTAQSLAIGQANFTFRGIMEAMRGSDRPWTMTFNETQDTAALASAQSAAPGAAFALPMQRHYMDTLHTLSATPTLVGPGPVPNIRPADLDNRCSATEEQMQRYLNLCYLAQLQCYLDLEVFVLSQRMIGALHAKQIQEETLQSIVRNFIATGSLLLYSSPSNACPSSLSSGDNTRTGLAVFVQHAVLKYVLFFPSDAAAYNLYLNSDRTLGSVTNENAGMNSQMAVLDAVQVVTRVSRPNRSPCDVMPASQPPISALSAPSPSVEQSTSAQSMQNYTVVQRFSNASGAGSSVEI